MRYVKRLLANWNEVVWPWRETTRVEAERVWRHNFHRDWQVIGEGRGRGGGGMGGQTLCITVLC